jgi:hypothetical protein
MTELKNMLNAIEAEELGANSAAEIAFTEMASPPYFSTRSSPNDEERLRC